MANVISFPRIDDKTLISIVRDIFKIETPGAASASVPGLRTAVNLLNETELSRFEESTNIYLIGSLDIRYEGYRLLYYRGGEPKQEARPSAFTDEIKFDPTIRHREGNEQLADDRRLAIFGAISKRINATGPAASAVESLDDLQQVYSSTFLKLETSFAEQIKTITDWTV